MSCINSTIWQDTGLVVSAIWPPIGMPHCLHLTTYVVIDRNWKLYLLRLIFSRGNRSLIHITIPDCRLCIYDIFTFLKDSLKFNSVPCLLMSWQREKLRHRNMSSSSGCSRIDESLLKKTLGNVYNVVLRLLVRFDIWYIVTNIRYHAKEQSVVSRSFYV